MLRKQITNIVMLKPKNKKEFEWINKDDSLILYNYIFDAPYTHFDIGTVEQKIYKNFNKLIISKD